MTRLYNLTAILLAIGLLASTPIYASTPSWKLIDGQILEGELRVLKNNEIQLLFPNGRQAHVRLKSFTPASRQAISNWAHAQGGSMDFASWIKTPETAFSKPWPRTVYGPASPKVHIIQKETQPGRYVFESEHYQFISDEKLAPRIVQQFASLFETTYLYNMALPLNVPGRYRSKGYKFPIYLFGSYKKYMRAGGPVGSGGVYLGSKQIILIPLISLGVSKKGNRWVYQKGGENMVLAHEITHQLMDGELRAAWFIEGSAEYIASTRYTHATFHVYGGEQYIFDSVTSKKASKANASRKIGPRIVMPKLKTFMNLPYSQFTQNGQANQNYGTALLLTYYFYHIDGSGNAHHIKNYVKALQRGKSESDAQKRLLNGRSYESLEKSFSQFCAGNGLTLEFR